MIVALAWAAVRRHPLSILSAALLVALSARLVSMSVPLVLLAWAALSLFGIGVWYVLEPLVVLWRGCRSPSRLERERLDRALGSTPPEVVVLDSADSWHGHGMRTLIVSGAVLDLLEDRAVPPDDQRGQPRHRHAAPGDGGVDPPGGGYGTRHGCGWI